MNLAFLGAAADDKPRLPGSLHVNRRLDTWLSFAEPGVVEVRPGKVELGQGILTALTQIAADELDVDPSRVRLVPTTTGLSPDEAVTSGSLSVQEGGMALRHACADARAIFLSVAEQSHGGGKLRVEDGRFLDTAGREVASYWSLAERDLLACEASPDAKPKRAEERRVAGSSLARVDLAAKVFGEGRYIHDLRFPGMRHARMVRPAEPGARLLGAPEHAALVRDGDFLAVVADTEAEAERLAGWVAARATWSPGRGVPEDFDAWLDAAPGEDSVVLARGEPPATAARTVRRTFRRPFFAHGSVGTCCALARWEGAERVHVLTHCQGPYNLRADLAKALKLSPDSVVVEHREGAGCYGHNGADDVALDAALAARPTPGVWVRALWSRAEELAWGPQTPAMRVDVEASLGADGAIASWRSHVRSNGHTGRPGRGALPTLLAAAHIAGGAPTPPSVNPPLAGGGGAQRNQVPMYRLPHLDARMTTLSDMPIRSSALRGLGALLHVLAIESVMDELAAGDPVGFRLRHLDDERPAAVLGECAAMSGFADRASLPEGGGMGIAVARYKNTGAWCAVAARVCAEERVRCTHLWLAADCGEAINPDGALNQLEGGAIHGVSVALFERTTTDGRRVTSDSWEAYPVLRFRDAPRVESRLLHRPHDPPLGAGEASMGPAIAAIAAAIRQALGIAPTRLPFTPENLAREEPAA
jgi:CO/xanthine dehydrogenase Mo-binding subunit